jgi:hypothetical protein
MVRPLARVALVVTVLVAMVLILVSIPAASVAAEPVGAVGEAAQDLGEPTTTTLARTMPDPTGRPVPPTAQRVLDSAVWFWLLGVVVAAGVWVWYRRRAGSHEDTGDHGHTGDDR